MGNEYNMITLTCEDNATQLCTGKGPNLNLYPGKFATLSFSLYIYKMKVIIHIYQIFYQNQKEKITEMHTLPECLINISYEYYDIICKQNLKQTNIQIQMTLEGNKLIHIDTFFADFIGIFSFLYFLIFSVQIMVPFLI